MPQDSMLSDIKKLQAVVDRLSALETPSPGKGLWVDRPAAPVQDQQYFATDATRRIQYFWDVSANNWLSTEQFVQTLAPRAAQPFPATGGAVDAVVPNYNTGVGGVGIYLEALQCFFLPATVAQSGANFFTLAFRVFNAVTNVDAALTLSGTTDTKLFTTINHGYSLAPTITPQVLAANSFTFTAGLTPTGAPGTFFFWATAVYRRVG